MTDAGPDPAERATYGFRRSLTRRPTSQEMSRILAFYRAELGRFRKDRNAATEVVKGYSGPPQDVSELAAWTMVANVLLNLDETITKE